MPGRLPGVALLAIFVALVLPASSRTTPNQKPVHKRVPTFFAECSPDTTCFDLDVSQGDNPDPVAAGSRLVYRITLQNHGRDAANNVFLDDFLPTYTTFVSVSTNDDGTDSGPRCLPPGSDDPRTVHCSFGTVGVTDAGGPPPAGPRVITLTVTPDPSEPGSEGPPGFERHVTNTAIVDARGDGSDSDPDNNESEEETTVTSPGELKLSKSHDDPAPPAIEFPYRLKIENTGDAATLDPSFTVPEPITLRDTLPHGFEFVRASEADQCSPDDAPDPLGNTIVTCHPQVSIPGKDPTTGTPGSYTITMFVIARQTGTFTNVADVSKYGGEIDTSDNAASDLTHVACPKPGSERSPQLCLIKTDSLDPVPQGQQFSYFLKVQNQRTGVEDDYTDSVRVTDTIPTGMTVVSTSGASCGVSGSTLTCTVPPPIPRGGSRTVTVNVKPLEVGTFENVACIGFRESEVCANQPTTIIGAADLMIEKTGAPTPVDVGQNLTYTIKVTNNGPGKVDHVQMDDSIPDGVDFVSSAVSPGTADCSLTTPSNFHCDLGTMGPVTSKTVTIVVKPTTPGTLTNTATVANDGTPTAPVDFDLTNNKATFSTDAVAADVAIAKTVAPATVGIGQPLTFTMTVTNKGPGVASGVVVTDKLPGSVSFPDTTTSKGTCTGTATITCDIGTMALNEVVTITIQVTPVTPGSVSNTAKVNTDSFDPVPANNSATSGTATVTAADVTITKTASPNPVAVGIALTYTLTVHNNGPNEATGVTVHDTLPDAVALPIATPSQGTCFGSPTVTCALGNLAPNFTATVTIVVTPLTAAGISNTASVTSAFDLNSSNNTSTVSSTVLAPRLDASPDIGAPGFVPVATGTDFPPNAPVELTWQPGLGKQTVITGADGTFSAQMLIFPNDTVGPRLLTATPVLTDDPATAFSPTSKDFLVVPPTSTPFQVKPQVPITKLVSRGG